MTLFSEESEDQPSKPSNVWGALVLVQTTPNHSNEDSTGWWLTYPSEKYEFVRWDDDIPTTWKNSSHVPNHQLDSFYTMELLTNE